MDFDSGLASGFGFGLAFDSGSAFGIASGLGLGCGLGFDCVLVLARFSYVFSCVNSHVESMRASRPWKSSSVAIDSDETARARASFGASGVHEALPHPVQPIP